MVVETFEDQLRFQFGVRRVVPKVVKFVRVIFKVKQFAQALFVVDH